VVFHFSANASPWLFIPPCEDEFLLSRKLEEKVKLYHLPETKSFEVKLMDYTHRYFFVKMYDILDRAVVIGMKSVQKCVVQ